MDLPTRLDLYALGRDYVIQKATRIDPATIDVAGTDVNIFVGSGSVVAASLIAQLAYSVNRLLLDGAERDDLDRLIFDRLGMPRKGAQAALGSVRMYRAAVGAAGSVPTGTKLTTRSGVEYVTTSVANFGGATLVVDPVYVRATQAGKDFQVGATAIQKFSSEALATLFDKTLQVVNDNPTAGGEPAEEDDDYRNRARDFWKAARRGILAAIEEGARAVPGVVSAQAIEVLGEAGQPARLVELYIADSSGVASDALALLVSQSLLEWRAAGITVLVYTSLPQLVEVSLRLSFDAGVETVALTESVRGGVLEFINSLPVNGTLYLAELRSVLTRFRVDGLRASDGTIVAPTGDLVPAVGRTLRILPEGITVVV